MSYAVEADLNLDADRLIELTEIPSALGVKDAATLTRLEAESEAIVDGVIGGSITLPFSTVPRIIKFITACIWKYRLYVHREIMTMPGTVKADYEFAMSLLAKIVDGEINLVVGVSDLSGVPEVESSCARGWTPRDQVGR